MLCNTKTGFPVFDGVSSTVDNQIFAICGGGGSSKSGVPNTVATCRLGPRSDGHAGVSVNMVDTINTQTDIATSCCLVNQDVIVFSIEHQLVVAKKRDGQAMSETYRHPPLRETIEIVRYFAPWLVVGTDSGPIYVFEFVENPTITLKPLFSFPFHRASVIDLCFAKPSYLASVSGDDTIRIWNLQTGRGEAILPSDASSKCVFRAAHFWTKDPTTIKLYTLQATKNRKASSNIVVWEGRRNNEKELEWNVVKIKEVASTLVTAFAIHPEEPIVAIGSTEAIAILHEDSLRPLRTVKKVHGLPVTGLFFNEGYAVSTSADGTCGMVLVKDLNGFQLLKFIKSFLSLLLLIITVVLFLVTLFVARSVKGNEAREHFLNGLINGSGSQMDFSNVDLDHINQFVIDFIYS